MHTYRHTHTHKQHRQILKGTSVSTMAWKPLILDWDHFHRKGSESRNKKWLILSFPHPADLFIPEWPWQDRERKGNMKSSRFRVIASGGEIFHEMWHSVQNAPSWIMLSLRSTSFTPFLSVPDNLCRFRSEWKVFFRGRQFPSLVLQHSITVRETVSNDSGGQKFSRWKNGWCLMPTVSNH